LLVALNGISTMLCPFLMDVLADPARLLTQR